MPVKVFCAFIVEGPVPLRVEFGIMVQGMVVDCCVNSFCGDRTLLRVFLWKGISGFSIINHRLTESTTCRCSDGGILG